MAVTLLSDERSLQRLNVRSLQALGAADDFKLDRLAVVQRAITIRNDGGEMDENVLPRLALDEAIALAGIEPLHCSLFFIHFSFLFSNKSYLVLLKSIGHKKRPQV
jgi:hypothetical protein